MKESKHDILLESGTNEIEIMEFTVSGVTFGINVAKVREILTPSPIKPMPHAHPAIEGIFKPRDSVMTVVNLPLFLGLDSEPTTDRSLFIITNFNNLNIAFRVHTVVGINRIYWSDIIKPDTTTYKGAGGFVTGIAQYDNRLISVLDFERIIAEISPETSIQESDIEVMGERAPNTRPIAVVEDSMMLSKMITDSLAKAGYTNIQKFNNGKEAWQYLHSIRDSDNILEHCTCVITDIEMPQMDGHRLIKLIKEDSRLKVLPVIVFSSLINDEMRIKGEELGADEQLSKPEIVRLVETLDRLIGEAESRA